MSSLKQHLVRLNAAFPDTPAKRFGNETERRFLEAWENRNDYPPWLLRVEKANLKKDIFHGVDVHFVTNDFGTIELQIKSSRFWAAKHRKRYGDRAIVIVIDLKDDAAMIRKKTLFLVNRRRDELVYPPEKSSVLANVIDLRREISAVAENLPTGKIRTDFLSWVAKMYNIEDQIRNLNLVHRHDSAK